jgi:hypothetical protein
MWIMTSYGILMPATIPADLAEDVGHLAFGFNMQVRSRDRATLQKCRARYMANFHVSEIVATPELDYEYRFYCNADDFADAVRWMVIEIDYEKFKPTTMRKGAGGKKLHRLYNDIWWVIWNRTGARHKEEKK